MSDKEDAIIEAIRKLDLGIQTNGLTTYAVLEKIYDAGVEEGKEETSTIDNVVKGRFD